MKMNLKKIHNLYEIREHKQKQKTCYCYNFTKHKQYSWQVDLGKYMYMYVTSIHERNELNFATKPCIH